MMGTCIVYFELELISCYAYSTSLKYWHLYFFLAKEKKPAKSTVIGVPVLLALEDVDGAPSFLEKALRFVEEYGGFSLSHNHVTSP